MKWEGIFSVLVTPFNEDLGLDLESLDRQIDFNLGCRVHGVVGPVIAGEFFTLSDTERITVIRRVANRLNGKVPYVAGISGVSGPHAADLAREAEQAGADAVLAMPPYTTPGLTREESIFRYFETVERATRLPLVVQNAPAPFGAPLGAEQLATLARRLDRVEVIKEETAPNPQTVGTIVKAAGGSVKAVFGGLGGIYLFNELARGAGGTMPACQFADVMVRIFDLYQANEVDRAREIFSTVQPALVMEGLYGMPFMKECLVRRGVLPGTWTRSDEPALDPTDKNELDAIWNRIEPHFTWHA